MVLSECGDTLKLVTYKRKDMKTMDKVDTVSNV